MDTGRAAVEQFFDLRTSMGHADLVDRTCAALFVRLHQGIDQPARHPGIAHLQDKTQRSQTADGQDARHHRHRDPLRPQSFHVIKIHPVVEIQLGDDEIGTAFDLAPHDRKVGGKGRGLGMGLGKTGHADGQLRMVVMDISHQIRGMGEGAEQLRIRAGETGGTIAAQGQNIGQSPSP